jgi:hypothetical protein
LLTNYIRGDGFERDTFPQKKIAVRPNLARDHDGIALFRAIVERAALQKRRRSSFWYMTPNREQEVCFYRRVKGVACAGLDHKDRIVWLAVCLSAIGYLFYTHSHLNLLIWLLMIYIGLFAMSHGAVVWVYISEVFPTRVRSKGQSLGSSSHWLTNAVISLIFPIFAKASGSAPVLFFAAMMVLDFFLVFFYYPETAGISLEEMQHKLHAD